MNRKRKFFTILSALYHLIGCLHVWMNAPYPLKRTQRILTNPFPQNKHFFTASKTPSTTQLVAIRGNSCPCVLSKADGGRKAFLQHPTHVRTHGVDNMKPVTEHLGQECPFVHCARVMSWNGMAAPQAGHISWRTLAKFPIAAGNSVLAPTIGPNIGSDDGRDSASLAELMRGCRSVERCCPSSLKSRVVP